MIEQMTLWLLLLVMPYQITATHTVDKEEIRQQVLQIEVESRAHRQKKSGRGL